jgi:hypothetical protein
MAKLKLGPLVDEKSVKLTIELPTAVHRDLVVYAEILGRDNPQSILDPRKLIAPMLARFMITDRAFAKARRERQTSPCGPMKSV